jgi:hypothetical protein
VASFLQFSQIIEDIKNNPTGHVFFAHLLLPHFPYIYDQTCSVKDHVVDWLGKKPIGAQVGEEEESAEFSKHLDQVECLYMKLQLFVNELKSQGLYDRLVFIVHGDHGARIARESERNSQDPQTQLDNIVKNHSTIFAKKMESTSVGYDAQLVQLDGLFAQTVKEIIPEATVRVTVGQYVYEQTGVGVGGEMLKIQISEEIEAAFLD